MQAHRHSKSGHWMTHPERKPPIHTLHPSAKIIVTMAYIIVVASCDSHEINKLLLMSVYPVYIFIMGEIPVGLILKRMLLALPFILGVGILSEGWMTFISLTLKGCLTISAALLLMATTGIDRIAMGLNSMKVPGLLILQLLLTYRYLGILVEEVYKIQDAYMLRAPGQKGIKLRVWGSLAGRLLLRTYDRAEKIHEAMVLRGFDSAYAFKPAASIALRDKVYMFVWCILMLSAGVIL